MPNQQIKLPSPLEICLRDQLQRLITRDINNYCQNETRIW